MAIYITIDGGTTNTRISLVKENEVSDNLKFDIGAGGGNKELLIQTIRDGIKSILKRNGLEEADITGILACGMLSSEFGITELEHREVPCGIAELNASMKSCVMEEISNIPITVMRGVKTKCDRYEIADMMRGEETELIGLLDQTEKNCFYIFPGSHSKVISVDENGRISDMYTFMTGEMLSALSKNTILKDAVKFEDSLLNFEYLNDGFSYCEKCGVNKALFKARVLKNMFNKSQSEIYSFFMGVVLQGEISEILKSKPKKIIIGGKKQIKDAMTALLTEKSSAEIISADDKKSEFATAFGMIKIFEYKNNNDK